MKTITSLCIASVLVLILSCNNSKKGNYSVADVSLTNANKNEIPPPKEAPPLTEEADSTAVVVENETPKINTDTNQDWEKKIIKTGDITLELTNYNTYNGSIRQSIKTYGAYIASEEQTQNDNRISNSIVIKVPVAQFEKLINSFNGTDIKVLEKKITSEDVTGEVVDTKARLEAKKQLRQRYLDLLKQAKNMKDVLDIEKEINDIQEDIESASGRVKYLDHQSAYSTINLTYFQYINGAGESGFWGKTRVAFVEGISIFSSFILFLISVWPLLIIIVIGWYLIRQWRKKRQLRAKK